jgi:hypothetical protein
MLTALDRQQLALLEQVRAQWAALYFATEPVDRAEAEEGVAEAYRQVGLNPPSRMVWVDSPLAGALAVMALLAYADDPSHPWWKDKDCGKPIDVRLIATQKQVAANVDAEVLSTARGMACRNHQECAFAAWPHCRFSEFQEPMEIAPGSLVMGHLTDQLEALCGLPRDVERGDDGVSPALPQGVIEGALAAAEPWLGELTWPQVTGRVRERIYDTPPYTVRPTPGGGTVVDGPNPNDEVAKRLSLTRAAYIHGKWRPALLMGQFQAAECGFLDFFSRLGLAGVNDVSALCRGACGCGWLWAYTDFAVLSDRPCVLSVDDWVRLHAEHGPAVAYRDGYAIYAHHGTLHRPSTPLGQ